MLYLFDLSLGQTTHQARVMVISDTQTTQRAILPTVPTTSDKALQPLHNAYPYIAWISEKECIACWTVLYPSVSSLRKPMGTTSTSVYIFIL
jgi:hypothetical protein